jgi:hypothetical protein
MLHRFASLIAVLFLFVAASPTLACMTEQAATHAQSDCCRAMHGRCGEMAKQGCCQQTTSTDQHPQMATATAALPFQWTSYGLSLTAALQSDPGTDWAFSQHAESPPGLHPGSIAILRI